MAHRYAINSFETDPRFPSGEWLGFFLQGGQRHWMTFYLEFGSGQIRGEGNDFVGPFHLSGRYDLASGYCLWTKQYVGRHQVEYEGDSGGQGIAGEWRIGGYFSDRFHIWPKGMGNLAEMFLEADRIQSRP